MTAASDALKSNAPETPELPSVMVALGLQLLVLQLAFELFRLRYLPHCLVEVVLVD